MNSPAKADVDRVPERSKMLSGISFKKTPAFLLIMMTALCVFFGLMIIFSGQTDAYAAGSSRIDAETDSSVDQADGSAITPHNAAAHQMRGIWLCFEDYPALGLSLSVDEAAYRFNADRFLTEAQTFGINTVFLHARASDDAFWRSGSFHASKYVGGDETLPAAVAYDKFDPFGVFLEEAHRYGIAVHAWLNPYRISTDYYLDPGDDASTERVLTAVKELLAYESNGEKVDGIHLDDYFYNAEVGYIRLGQPSDIYVITDSEAAVPETGKYAVVTPAEKRANVNKMVKELCRVVHEAGRTFGISPGGNYDNDMNDGADIDTWLSEEGYIDYIVPQIYWSNQWGEGGDTAMFTDRLDLFLGKWKDREKQKNKVDFYVGLALYKTEEARANDDPGWKMKSTNLKEQIAELESKGADGYVLFSARYLFESCAAQELFNIRDH